MLQGQEIFRRFAELLISASIIGPTTHSAAENVARGKLMEFYASLKASVECGLHGFSF